jgi:hypothetical protein
MSGMRMLAKPGMIFGIPLFLTLGRGIGMGAGAMSGVRMFFEPLLEVVCPLRGRDRITMAAVSARGMAGS